MQPERVQESILKTAEGIHKTELEIASRDSHYDSAKHSLVESETRKIVELTDKMETTSEQQAIAIAESLTTVLAAGHDMYSSWTPEIILDSGNAEVFGEYNLVGLLHAHGICSTGQSSDHFVHPKDGGPANYVLVVSLVQNRQTRTQAISAFKKSEEQKQLRERAGDNGVNIPGGSTILIDVQKIVYTDGGLVVEGDFDRWATKMLNRLKDRKNANSFYVSPETIAFNNGF